eukprot:4401042-Pyramimonas_sp.AAC.1
MYRGGNSGTGSTGRARFLVERMAVPGPTGPPVSLGLCTAFPTGQAIEAAPAGLTCNWSSCLVAGCTPEVRHAVRLAD